jgi:hypothetical protein
MLAVLGLVTPARGDDVDAARALFRQGNELHEKNDLNGALEKYEAAHALVATPITGLMVARTHLELGHLLAARDVLVAVRKMPVKPKESDNTKAARTEADKLADELDARIPKIVVIVDGPADAKIEIDGAIASREPRAVDPGKHIVVVRALGETRTTELTVAEKETREVKVTIAAPKPAVVVAPAPAPTPIAETPASRPAWIWVGFGVAGAGIIVGTVTGVMTLRGTGDLRDSCPGGRCPPDQHDRLSSTQTWSTVSTVSFAIAGTAAAVSLVGLLTTPSARVTPTVGMGSIGLSGSF